LVLAFRSPRVRSFAEPLLHEPINDPASKTAASRATFQTKLILNTRIIGLRYKPLFYRSCNTLLNIPL
jgi:hypothetical protein